jgi:putative ABC transport system ATP-binding protein
MNEIVIECKHLYKNFGDQIVFSNYNLSIKKNKCLVIQGESGSGKSTLLNMIGLLDKPTQGDVVVFNHVNVKPFSKQAEYLLKEKIGYLFQNFALVDDMSVYGNLKIALKNVKTKHKDQLIKDALHKVGLKGFANKLIYQCSGGEQQRIAIARLLLKPCELVLCDEPTGSLDDANKEIVLNLLNDLKNMGKTIVIVTHDHDVLKMADEVVELKKIMVD